MLHAEMLSDDKRCEMLEVPIRDHAADANELAP
jgi:hypothetical protein